MVIYFYVKLKFTSIAKVVTNGTRLSMQFTSRTTCTLHHQATVALIPSQSFKDTRLTASFNDLSQGHPG